MGIETTTAAAGQRLAAPPGPGTAPPPSASEGSTARFKLIPPEREVRCQIRAESARVAANLDRARPLTRDTLRGHAESLLQALGLPEGYLGFTMVTISNEFWREQFMAVDFKRRLLLLPHCLKLADGCPADYSEMGMNCTECGLCKIGDFKTSGEKLGYKVLVAEGTPIVLKVITSGQVDAILGVACLNVLERSLEKVLKVGVPSLAVPLLSSNCTSTSVDTDWVEEAIHLRTAPPAMRTRTYLPLLRLANEVFSDGQIEKLLQPKRRSGRPAPSAGEQKPPDPIAATEQIGCDWLAVGGKRFRPFITLAAYDAFHGGMATLPADVSAPVEMPDAVKRVAMAMEVFHKASLIHDDIEDDDTYRYGRETLHRTHGLPTAINVGDYLVGLGYRIVSREAKALGPEVVADVLDRLAQAHQSLAEGQGAELIWRDATEKDLTPLDALKIYALKTAPAFEAALYTGLRLAGAVDGYGKLVADFSRNLGVAYQILNDLKDWDGDDDNKLVSGQDVVSARPTLLLALAQETATPEQKAELRRLLGNKTNCERAIRRVRQIYTANGVFAKAEAMVQKYRERCETVAGEAQTEALRELLHFLVDTVLERELPEPTATVAPAPIRFTEARPR
jgi:geranylgeranyl pyrophosphate synthase